MFHRCVETNLNSKTVDGSEIQRSPNEELLNLNVHKTMRKSRRKQPSKWPNAHKVQESSDSFSLPCVIAPWPFLRTNSPCVPSKLGEKKKHVSSHLSEICHCINSRYTQKLLSQSHRIENANGFGYFLSLSLSLSSALNPCPYVRETRAMVSPWIFPTTGDLSATSGNYEYFTTLYRLFYTAHFTKLLTTEN